VYLGHTQTINLSAIQNSTAAQSSNAADRGVVDQAIGVIQQRLTQHVIEFPTGCRHTGCGLQTTR
jgi:hypothetical protein